MGGLTLCVPPSHTMGTFDKYQNLKMKYDLLVSRVDDKDK
jgi:hypothetical protein